MVSQGVAMLAKVICYVFTLSAIVKLTTTSHVIKDGGNITSSSFHASGYSWAVGIIGILLVSVFFVSDSICYINKGVITVWSSMASTGEVAAKLVETGLSKAAEESQKWIDY